MKRWRTVAAALLIAAATLTVAACGEDEQEEVAGEADSSPAAATADIVDTAIAAGDFTTLIAALEAAGLDEALRGAGPFTVFAPTDDAFAALPAGTLDELLADPSGALTDVLSYHVAPDVAAPSADFGDAEKLATLLEDESVIVIQGSDGEYYVENIKIITTDVQATNGVIHVIEGVLVP
ncbi:MAG: fasciclin domain-containing protein [Thermoleophilia bacterium]|nr:fasciclin domain-containing protein [Thermoleophilia bacterium]